MSFGRNRESRSREAAGRRNWPEAVPRRMRGRKRTLAEVSENRDVGGTRVSESCELFVTQGHHGVESHRTACGKVTREQRHSDPQTSRHREGQRIDGTEARKEARQ